MRTWVPWAAIRNELNRQAVKHPGHTCADDTLTNEQKFVILAEEVGEVANALTYDSRSDLREELIQVTAVALAWLSSL